MIIDLSDPAISAAYHHILNGESKDWLILTYSKARDALHLADSGAGGPDALRSHLAPYAGDVTFGLVQAGGPNALVLVCYIPAVVGGVKRARAIVHERALEDAFPARRAVLNVASETEITLAALERVLHATSLPMRRPVAPSHPPPSHTRPMSPPTSFEEVRPNRTPSWSKPQPPLPPPPPQVQERGLPLNLPEDLDPERKQELDKQQQEEAVREKQRQEELAREEQQARATRMLAPSNGGSGLAGRTPSPRPGKPQLSVAVPPRGERGLRPMKYDHELDADDNDEDDENNDNDDKEEEDNTPGEEKLILRSHSRPSSRGPTPPPGPSILRHPSPMPPRPDLAGSVGALSSTSHIRFTGPPKDHPHPDHHPLKPTDQIVSSVTPNKASSQILQQSHAPINAPRTAHAPLDGLPAPNPPAFQRAPSASPKPEEGATSPPGPGAPNPPPHPTVAPSLLPSAITWQSTSQPGQSIPNLDANTYNSSQPSQSLRSTSDPMPPPTAATGLANRPLPPQPPSTFSARPSASSASEFAAHSRNPSVSTAAGQTHVPSGTLSAFGRRPSVSSLQQNGGANPNSALLTQPNHASPSSLLERSSTNTSGVTSASSTSTTYRPIQVQTQGMTEAQAQAARSRAKWAAEEQGITVPPPSVPTGSLPRSPPLTPPTSPPRSLNPDEAGRVRRDGIEKMRREAERRREEDEKKRVAEERRKAEAEQQLKVDKERVAREEREMAEREVKRKDMELKRRAMEEEQGKRRAEEKVNIKEKFEQVRGTEEVFLTGHVNVQPENAMTWKWRFYELTASGRLSLYKSSDASDRIKPLDVVVIKDARKINRSADELELISYAFRVEYGGNKESWSFYSDSQHDMDVLTDGMTWTMGS
ncbi:hypothetical protein FRC12_013049 [Ceratobasidium sp. 428]|nr:hypothetical protein FRC12_013049 [Ceratobasidium sp. 428]